MGIRNRLLLQTSWAPIVAAFAVMLAACGGGGGGGGGGGDVGGVPPAAPTNLSATTLSSASIHLSWTDVSVDESEFLVERGATASGPWTAFAVPANSQSFTDSTLTASTTYFYRLASSNAFGLSPYAGPIAAATFAAATTPPTAPSNLAATSTSSSSVSLSWTDNSNNETGFKVERATTSTGPFTQITTVGAGVTSFSNTGLSASTTYYYRIRATNSTGDSAYSSTANATTPATATIPAAPSNLTAMATSSSSISLSWTDNSSNETGFKIERGTALTGPFTEIIIVGTGSTTFLNTGLAASTTYYYRIRATNSAGNSVYSNTASATTPATTTIPVAPSNLAATATSSSSISLSWTDNSTNETSFKIERATASAGPFVQIGTTAAGVTTFSNTGLNASTTYYFRVRASNGAGDSTFTNVASATTPGSTTVTLSPTADNLTLVNSQDSATANTNFRFAELAVGCNWGMTLVGQTYVCGRSLVRFDVASLAGKTIDSATLRLTTNYVGVGFAPRQWQIWAIATAWSTTTVTWNIVNPFQYYTANRLNNLSPPTFSGQVFNLNVTGIVQSWANGTFVNNGLILEIEDYTFPNMISLDAFAFYSLEDPGQEWPRLIVTYR